MRVVTLSCRVIEQARCRAERMGDIPHSEMATSSKSRCVQAIMALGYLVAIEG